MSKRSEGMAQIIGEIIAPFVYKILDPEIFGLATITHVKVSTDFSFADVYISTMKNKKELEEILRKNVYHIQKELNQKLQKKRVPKIRFKIDFTSEYVDKIYSKLNE